ncbi:MAG: hypothetical protein INR73_00120 [Williamsia sp.]|nr:hypothetical protein [Williamsia sp.]
MKSKFILTVLLCLMGVCGYNQKKPAYSFGVLQAFGSSRLFLHLEHTSLGLFSQQSKTAGLEGFRSVDLRTAGARLSADLFAAGQAVSILNCGDEPYIAAGTGSALGIMRHPFTGNLPNGKQDHVFPPSGRDLKRRLDGEVRCAMWHRIALLFAINKTENRVDAAQLHDYRVIKNNESY